jgi:hypothetical protein
LAAAPAQFLRIAHKNLKPALLADAQAIARWIADQQL